MNKTLTICIPTYNRKDVIIKDVHNYLLCKDKRFCIKVSDNKSTDGTFEELSNIMDERLFISQNETNIGSVPNWIQALSGCNSDYILFLLDKDFLDIDLLPTFLDYLENNKPNFGYVDLDISKRGGIKEIPKGIEGVCKMCYLDKHPSGYFYRKCLFEKAVCHPTFLAIDKMFIFPFEVLNGSIAVHYSSSIFEFPLIINASLREKKDTRTLSFNDSNIWFGGPKRFVEYNYYLDNALNIGLNKRETALLTKRILSVQLGYVTYGLRTLYKDEEACYHYYVKTRNVPFKEMMGNVIKYSRVYMIKTRQKLPFVVIVYNLTIVVAKNFVLTLKSLF